MAKEVAISHQPATPLLQLMAFRLTLCIYVVMKSTKVQTLGTLNRNVEPIHKCGTTTIDGLEHQKEQHVMHHFHGRLGKKWPALFLFEAQKIYKVEKLPTFHLSINFRITCGLFSAKKIKSKVEKKRPALHLSRQTSTDAVLCRTVRCPLRNMGQW